MSDVNASPLGKSTQYTDQYDPSLLFAIDRKANRESIGINSTLLPFNGCDVWNGFDLSWLDDAGIPQYGMLTIFVPAVSPNLIESKSLKLYLFSFANSKFNNRKAVIDVLENDLSAAAGCPVQVRLSDQRNDFIEIRPNFVGINIDDQSVLCTVYDVEPKLLNTKPQNIVTEQLCSDLLKSNCLVTGNPDWGSVRISYTGPQINRESLLQYIVSYRNHQGFHEQCIEHIFIDILNICKPTKLAVEGRYTRRGGLDINPIRTNTDTALANIRLFRQ